MASRLETVTDIARYRRDYERGWRSTCDLDTADRRGDSLITAWMDGRFDAGAGRAKWHLLHCPDHDTCGQA